MLAKYGSVYGVDQSEKAVMYAKSKNIAQEVRLSSITSLPYNDNSFDIVVCLDVLYHAKSGNDNNGGLSEFYRVLRPGGVLIVREPAYNWLRGHQDEIVWTKRRYNKNELVSMLSQAGFEPYCHGRQRQSGFCRPREHLRRGFRHRSLGGAIAYCGPADSGCRRSGFGHHHSQILAAGCQQTSH